MTREEIIANCRIKTKEQFIEECRKNGIEDDWYNFSEEHTRPVSIGESQVTYGKRGWTGCAFPETRWDEAKKEFGFTETPMRGTIKYPVTGIFRDEIFQCLEKDKVLSEEIKEKLTEHYKKSFFEKALIKDEFLALYHLKKNLPEAMIKALDKSQSKKGWIKTI